MIDPKQLRIGNLVESSGKIIEVDGITESSINPFIAYPDWGGGASVDYIKIEDTHPILLTKEWLIKFGFEDDMITWSKTGKYPWLTEHSIERGWAYWLFGLSGGVTGYIKYVHQLQNLVFTLTEKELTYDTTNAGS